MLNMHPAVHVPVELFGLYTDVPRALPWYGDLRHAFNRLLLARDLAYVGQLRQFGVHFDVEGFAARLAATGHDLAAVIGCFYETLQASAEKAVLGDKTPNNAPQLALIDRLFPSALVVHLVRDGRDCAASSVRTREGINQRNVQELAQLWPRNNLALARFGEHHPHRYHRLRYEDLIADPQARLRSLCAFLELPFDERMLDFSTGEFARDNAQRLAHHTNLSQGILEGNRGKWRTELSEREIALYEAMAGAALQRFGYPLTDAGAYSRPFRWRCQAGTAYRRLRRAARTLRIEARRFVAITVRRGLHRLRAGGR
jgi:hypothetical protein